MAETEKQILQQFFEDVRSDIISNSEQQNRNATGKAKQSLRIEVGETQGKLIDGAGYTEWGWEYGRRPGKMPPREAIEKWIDAKGIIPNGISKSSLAFLIQRKIGREGSVLFRQHEPSGVITDAVSQDRIDSLKGSFSELFASLVKTEMIRAFT